MSTEDKSKKVYFPIGELSARTHVNTVTLRAWERRYGLLQPKRTEKGHRLYSIEDVYRVEKILTMMARGVSIGKVKPLLLEGSLTIKHDDDSDVWSALVSDVKCAAESFAIDKLGSRIQDACASYPIPIVREQLMEPVFSALALRRDGGAALGFIESELVKYTVMRLNTRGKKSSRSIILIAGNKVPIWRLALMALELADSNFSVSLFNRPFNVQAVGHFTDQMANVDVVFYQDGLWSEQEKGIAAEALSTNERLLLCGTAPVLAQLQGKDRVHTDIESCTAHLLQAMG